MKKLFFAVLPWFFAAVWVSAQDSFARGEELFMRNNPKEASVYLENAINEDPNRIQAFLYLGIAYEQTDRTDEAITVYRQVLNRAGELTANVANNLGNVYFKKGVVSDAESMYTRAIEANRMYAPAWLGRANARLRQGTLREAVTDYEQYLQLEPRSPQKGTIERLVAYVKAEAAEAERRRLAAEEAARVEAAEAERKRLAAEEAARVEAERRQRFLDEVSASLHGAAGTSQGLSSGAENVEGYEGEFELE